MKFLVLSNAADFFPQILNFFGFFVKFVFTKTLWYSVGFFFGGVCEIVLDFILITMHFLD